jgi:glycosyltransferase involved in cell wall biosynthesis
MQELELTILMPCLNEAETLETCIEKANKFLASHNVKGEVVIADNGSTDGSQEIARRNGARVVDVPQKGYGSALINGNKAALGKFIIMGDADDSYDFSSLMPFVDKLRSGYELVMGNRFKGGIEKDAMPKLHKYLGNPVLSGIGKLFYKSDINDFHCGLRGFSKEAIIKLDLHTTGMEYASEMVVKATINKLKITEVPTTLSKDGRSRPPHLKSWQDGWRHLKFLLMHSPRWLFLYPGLLLFFVGIIGMSLLLFGPLKIGSIHLDVHTLLYMAISIIVGVQIISFALFTMVYAVQTRLFPKDDKLIRILSAFSLEKGLITGSLLFLGGIILTIFALVIWKEESFSDLNPSHMMRITIPALTLTVIGVQVIFSSFFLSILNIKHKNSY